MMAKTILNLKLNYRGKHLDTIRQDADFKNHWLIGTDKHIFWQILDDSQKFPAKHKLLVKRGSDFYLQLPDGSNLSCNKDGKPLDANYLQQNGILSGSLLKLRPDLSGNVRVHPDYEIQFEYTEPVKAFLRPAEQAVVNSSMHAAPLSSSERTEVGLILLFLILGIAFVMIYDLVIKPKMEEEKTLTEMLAELERVRRIEPQLGLAQPPTTEFETPPEEQTPAQEQQTPAGRETTRKPAVRTPTTPPGQRAPDPRQIFGTQTGTTPGDRTTQTAFAVTGLGSFVTARPGARAGSGASPSSSGSGTFNPQAATGFSGSFDPNATSGFDSSVSNMARVAPVQPGQAGSTTRPNIPTQSFTGDASRLQPYQPGQWPTVPAPKEGAERVTQSVVKAPEITKIPEPEVRIPKPASSVPDADIIFNQISARRGQIEQSYKRNAAIKKQTGSITVLMDIAENGSVSARVTSNSSTFTQSFLNDIKRIVESWSFNVSKPTKYQFRMNLTQA